MLQIKVFFFFCAHLFALCPPHIPVDSLSPFSCNMSCNVAAAVLCLSLCGNIYVLCAADTGPLGGLQRTTCGSQSATVCRYGMRQNAGCFSPGVLLHRFASNCSLYSCAGLIWRGLACVHCDGRNVLNNSSFRRFFFYPTIFCPCITWDYFAFS